MFRVIIQHSQEDDRFYVAVYQEVSTELPIRVWEQKAMDAKGHDTLEQATPDFLEFCEFFNVSEEMDVVIVPRAGTDAICEELSMAQ